MGSQGLLGRGCNDPSSKVREADSPSPHTLPGSRTSSANDVYFATPAIEFVLFLFLFLLSSSCLFCSRHCSYKLSSPGRAFILPVAFQALLVVTLEALDATRPAASTGSE